MLDVSRDGHDVLARAAGPLASPVSGRGFARRRLFVEDIPRRGVELWFDSGSAGGEADVRFEARSQKPEARGAHRSEEHTSELQSQSNLVCRLLLEKKK